MNQKDFDQIVDELVYHHVSRSGTKTTELNQELSLSNETAMVGGENDIDLSILDLDQNRSSLPLRKVKKSDLNKDQLLIKTMKIDKVNVKVMGFSWSRLVEEFDKRYDTVFGSISAKAHLDISACVIDGAKDRWKHVMLFDTLVAFLLRREKSQVDCDRRRFNQYAALRESVCCVASESFIKYSFAQIVIDEKALEIEQSSGLNVMPGRIEIKDMSLKWLSLDNLRVHLLDHSTSKSWKKRKSSVDSLCTIPQVLELGLSGLIHKVVETIYREHFIVPIPFVSVNSSHHHTVNVHYNNYYNSQISMAAAFSSSSSSAISNEVKAAKVSSEPTITQMAVPDSPKSDNSSIKSSSPTQDLAASIPVAGPTSLQPPPANSAPSSSMNYTLHYESEITPMDPLYQHCMHIMETAKKTATSQNIEIKDLFNFFKQHRKEPTKQSTQHQVASLMTLLSTAAHEVVTHPKETVRASPRQSPRTVPSPKEIARVMPSPVEAVRASPKETARVMPNLKEVVADKAESIVMKKSTDRASRSKQVETAPAPVKVEATDRTSRSKQVETAPAPVNAPVKVEATDRYSRSKQVETAPASVKVESTDRTSRSKQVETAPAPVKAKFNLTEPPVVYLTTGSQYIGRQVKRTFGKSKVIGTITGWLPPDGDDIALWHVEHVDGDEEDLEEFEVEKYILAVDDPESIAASEKRAAKLEKEKKVIVKPNSKQNLSANQLNSSSSSQLILICSKKTSFLEGL